MLKKSKRDLGREVQVRELNPAQYSGVDRIACCHHVQAASMRILLV